MVAVNAQTVIYSENFDEMTAGQSLISQSNQWTTWSGGTESESGVIDNAVSQTAPQYKSVCLSFNGQIFDNESSREEIDDYHLYYNLRLIPIFTLPKNWSISANLMYNSPLMSKTITEGDYFFASLRVSKQIGNWSVHAELSDPFHYQTTDKYYLSEDFQQHGLLYGQKSYYLYHQYLNLGVMYRF